MLDSQLDEGLCVKNLLSILSVRAEASYMQCMYRMISMNDVIRMNPSDIEVYGTVRVGGRGQVVIPSQARKEFNIKPGDLLLVVRPPMGDAVALIKAEVVKKLIEKMSKGLAEPGGRMKSTSATKRRK